VRQDAPPGQIEIYLEKRMGYGGKPGRPLSIRDERRKMGCCWKSDGDRLLIATHGWWASKEGGTGMELRVRVPPGLRVERRTFHDFPKGQGTARLADLGPGWELIPDEPDPDWRARGTFPFPQK
jgi:hypothetical protein